MRPHKLSLYFCRVVYKRAARAGCHCISCDWRRSVGKQWKRDQRRMRTAYHVRTVERQRERDRRNKGDIGRLMYYHMRQMARREGLWHI